MRRGNSRRREWWRDRDDWRQWKRWRGQSRESVERPPEWPEWSEIAWDREAGPDEVLHIEQLSSGRFELSRRKRSNMELIQRLGTFPTQRAAVLAARRRTEAA
jgi:hypothetical protein